MALVLKRLRLMPALVVHCANSAFLGQVLMQMQMPRAGLVYGV